MRKGRHRRGRVLDDNDVLILRLVVARLTAAGRSRLSTQEAVARMMGVSLGYVNTLVDGLARPPVGDGTASRTRASEAP